MMSSSISSRSASVSIATSTVGSVATPATVASPTQVLQSVVSSTECTQELDKSEINDAVTKVLQGYDWTLVPIASK